MSWIQNTAVSWLKWYWCKPTLFSALHTAPSWEGSPSAAVPRECLALLKWVLFTGTLFRSRSVHPHSLQSESGVSKCLSTTTVEYLTQHVRHFIRFPIQGGPGGHRIRPFLPWWYTDNTSPSLNTLGNRRSQNTAPPLCRWKPDNRELEGQNVHRESDEFSS